MTIVEMSISAGLFILATTAIRALAIHKLPHKCFMFLWHISLLLLIVPIRFASPVSIFSLFREETVPIPMQLPALTGYGNSGITSPLPATTPQMAGDVIPQVPLSFWDRFSPWLMVWLVGGFICAGFFVFTHLRCRSRYKMSLPCDDLFVVEWLSTHGLWRRMQVRVSDRVMAPLTYGIFHPVILLPKQIDWSNATQMDYILTHESVHIRRFDVGFKALLVAAVCIHWFNPLVWLLFVLAGRDIELVCDEVVVRITGRDRKKDYALALLSLEERRSRFAPLCTSFSMNGVEERIRGIMKMKKTTVMGVLLAIVVVAATITVFATTGRSQPGDEPHTLGTEDGFVSSDYPLLLGLRFDGYEEMKVGAFRNAVHEMMSENEDAYRIEFDTATRDNRLDRTRNTNEDASFVMNTLIPLTADSWQSWQYGEYFVEAAGMAEYQFVLTILDSNKLTVTEHTGIWRGMASAIGTALKNAPSSLWFDEEGMTNLLETAAQTIMNAENSAQHVDLRYISFLPNDSLGQEDEMRQDESQPPATDQQYEMLLALAVPGYRDQSVAQFREGLLETYITFGEEAYLDAHEAVARDMAYGRTTYPLTDEQRYFLQMTLQASGSENAEIIRAQYTGELEDPWIHGHAYRERRGTIGDSNHELIFMASADYIIDWHIHDKNRLTIAQRDAALSGVMDGIQSYVENAEDAVLLDGKAALQAEINRLTTLYSNGLIEVVVDGLHLDVMDEKTDR